METPQTPTAPAQADGGRSLMRALDSAISSHQTQQLGGQAPDPAGFQPDAPKEEQVAPEVKTDLAPDKDKPENVLEDFENPWEAQIKTEEEKADEKKEDPKQEVQEPAFKSEAQKVKWGELRSKAEELDKLKPEVETLRAKVAELEKAEPKLAPEIETELQELRNFRAAYDIENTPEYQQSVVAPMAEVKTTLDQVAEYAAVDAKVLYDALDISNPLQRAAAIRKALTASENDVGEDAIQLAVQATNEFHKNVVPKMQELKANAAEIQRSLQGQKQVEQAKMSEQQQAKLQASYKEIYAKLETGLKPIPGLFDDPRVSKAMQEATLADPATKPMHAAYQAQVAAVMPYMIQTVNKLIQRNAALEKLAQSRSGAAASPSAANRQGPAPQQGPDNGRSLMEGLSEMGIR